MKRFVWLGLIVLVLGLAYWGLSRAFVTTSAGALVTRGNVINGVTGSVVVASDAQTLIASPDAGTLLDCPVVEGQRVKTGEIIGQLDPRDIPFLQEEARTKLADVEKRLKEPLASELGLATLEKQLVVDKALFEANQMGPADYEDRERAVAQQRALAQEQRSELETDRAVYKNSLAKYDNQLSRLKIVAPYDGVITAVYAHKGDVLAMGSPIASIISTDLKVIAEVNQDDIAAVQPNQTAKVRFFAYHNAEFPARVKLVLPSSDPSTQRFKVILELVNPSQPVPAGLTGEVSFNAGEHDNTLFIPRRALIGNKNVAVASGGRVQIREVEPGFITLDKAEILKGVNEGEIVLTENLDLFRDGDPVRLSAVAGGKAP